MGRFEETQHHHDLLANILLIVNNNKSYYTNKLPKCNCKMKFVKTIKKRGCLPNAEDVTRSVVRGKKKLLT